MLDIVSGFVRHLWSFDLTDLIIWSYWSRSPSQYLGWLGWNLLKFSPLVCNFWSVWGARTDDSLYELLQQSRLCFYAFCGLFVIFECFTELNLTNSLLIRTRLGVLPLLISISYFLNVVYHFPFFLSSFTFFQMTFLLFVFRRG